MNKKKYLFAQFEGQKNYDPIHFKYVSASPLISIHVPIYKRKYCNINYDFVVNTVALAYLQTFDDWELNLIDDHDGDLNLTYLFNEVEKILNQKVDRAKVLYHRAENDCIGNKRNELIKYSTTPIICNWDDDDLYLPKYLSVIYQFYQDNPYRFGIVVGKRWQYNLLTKQRLLWTRDTCNGAAYHVLRTDILKEFAGIRYTLEIDYAEEETFLLELDKAIGDQKNDIFRQPHQPLDEEYVRIRFGGNITHEGGWLNDVKIKKASGGYLIDDLDFEWLYSKIPALLHNKYKDLIIKIRR